MRNLVMGCAVAALVALSARSEARSPELRMLQVGTPSAAKAQFGLASWYGQEFHGHPTASGQSFDMEGLTCAHRKLPLGTLVKVTNVLNARWLVLEVTDRGPWVANRVLDVSKGAAKRLGFIDAGLTPVCIQVVSYPQSSGELISQANPQTSMWQTN
ncbi:MAG: septal ring lytic transglycosylase RlpA family protein [Acidobacteria bacterium]|nr:MAG: septal ring lytic transglycosylase RlpA family protein [Acidobacteriota bacterium]